MTYDKAKQSYSVWGAWIDPEQFVQKESLPSKKVSVNKETSDALDLAFEAVDKQILTKYKMINACAKKLWGEEANVLNKMTPEVMLDILLNGYEAEQTEEQKLEYAIKKAHNSFGETCETLGDFYSYRAGLRDALRLMGKSYNWLELSQDVAKHTISIAKATK